MGTQAKIKGKEEKKTGKKKANKSDRNILAMNHWTRNTAHKQYLSQQHAKTTSRV